MRGPTDRDAKSSSLDRIPLSCPAPRRAFPRASIGDVSREGECGLFLMKLGTTMPDSNLPSARFISRKTLSSDAAMQRASIRSADRPTNRSRAELPHLAHRLERERLRGPHMVGRSVGRLSRCPLVSQALTTQVNHAFLSSFWPAFHLYSLLLQLGVDRRCRCTAEGFIFKHFSLLHFYLFTSQSPSTLFPSSLFLFTS